MLKLFVCDIDNTLFDQKIGIPKANIEAIQSLHQAGITVALASGRSYHAMKIVVDALQLSDHCAYVIASNGAHIIETKTQKVLYQKTHPVDTLKHYAQVAKELGIDFACEQADVLYHTHDNESVRYERELCGMKTKLLTDFEFELTQSASKIMMQVNPLSLGLEMDVFVQRFKHEVSCERFHKTYMDIIPLGHSKLTGVDVLLNELQLKRSEVAAIGDGENDRILLSHVGLSAAPSNAHMEIQSLVDHVVPSAKEAGVAHFIQLVLLKNNSSRE